MPLLIFAVVWLPVFYCFVVCFLFLHTHLDILTMVWSCVPTAFNTVSLNNLVTSVLFNYNLLKNFEKVSFSVDKETSIFLICNVSWKAMWPWMWKSSHDWEKKFSSGSTLWHEQCMLHIQWLAVTGKPLYSLRDGSAINSLTRKYKVFTHFIHSQAAMLWQIYVICDVTHAPVHVT